VPPSQQATTTNDLINAALEPIRDYYSYVENGVRKAKPLAQRIEGWARLIYDLDGYSMRRFLKEYARFSDETVEAIGTIENLTSRMALSFFHSFLGRSDINPSATYWEIAGGTARLTDALLPFVAGEVRMDRRMIRMEYWDASRDCSSCRHVSWRGALRTATLPRSANSRSRPTTASRATYAGARVGSVSADSPSKGVRVGLC